MKELEKALSHTSEMYQLWAVPSYGKAWNLLLTSPFLNGTYSSPAFYFSLSWNFVDHRNSPFQLIFDFSKLQSWWATKVIYAAGHNSASHVSCFEACWCSWCFRSLPDTSNACYGCTSPSFYRNLFDPTMARGIAFSLLTFSFWFSVNSCDN